MNSSLNLLSFIRRILNETFKKCYYFFISLIFFECFFYSLNRTYGNILKLLQFALYFLVIKIGLIAPNIPLELNQDHPRL